jgi:DNA polymerase
VSGNFEQEPNDATPFLPERHSLKALRAAAAGKALFGSKFTIRDARGRPIDSDLGPFVAATIHPSAILRARDDDERRRERQAFTDDLRAVAVALSE